MPCLVLDIVVSSTDSPYVIDYTHTYGVGLAKKIKLDNPSAKIVIFFPAVRAYVKSEIEKMGCIPYVSSDFFSKTKDIIRELSK